MVQLSVGGTWSGLPKEIASELFARATFHRLKAGETLFQIGDIGDGCYRLDKGLLKVSLISPQVRERIIAILTPGAVVGDLAVIDGLPRTASVFALTNCELRFLSRVAFERLAQEHPEIHRYLVKLLAARLRQADDVIASLAFLPVKARVAHALLGLAENLGEETDSGGILIPRAITETPSEGIKGIGVKLALANFLDGFDDGGESAVSAYLDTVRLLDRDFLAEAEAVVERSKEDGSNVRKKLPCRAITTG
jgi:CRP/FNR family cyclic AMP-dependent transcriptional regulator